MADSKKIRPQDKWNANNNYVSKSFKMYKDLADEFKEACDKAGIPQSTQVQIMMREFIAKMNEE